MLTIARRTLIGVSAVAATTLLVPQPLILAQELPNRDKALQLARVKHKHWTTPPKGCEQYAPDWGLVPGDEGYNHVPLHLLYKVVFGELAQCPCHSGECRQSISRPTEYDSQTGWDVQVNRVWYPVNFNVRRPDKKLIINTLKDQRMDWDPLFVAGTAHVCAYPNSGSYCSDMNVACAIINPLQG